MKVALVHDWLTGYRGGEKCLSAFLDIYPDADIYSLIHVPGTTTVAIDNRVKGTSFLQKFPLVKKYYRALLPLFPLAVRSLKLENYDLVISLSHAAVKNIKLPKNTVHVCYCFTPMRYVWDQAFFYFGKFTYLLFPILYCLRVWDRRASSGVDHFIAISKFVSARIRCFYGRKSFVIFPPVSTNWIKPNYNNDRKYFLWAGALVPYKRADLVVKVCSEHKLPLKVAGNGPLLEHLKSIAGESVQFLGRVSDRELAELYAGAKALIFPAIEDFGMIPVECMAAGTPVLGLNAGGSREIINGFHLNTDNQNIVNPTGILLNKSELTQRSLYLAILQISEAKFNPEDCVKQARLFSDQVFRDGWRDFFINKLKKELTERGVVFDDSLINS